MDNREFRVSGVGSLATVMRCAFEQEGGERTRATHYVVHPDHGLVLLWAEEAGASPMLFPHDAAAAALAASAWLEMQTYPVQPDQDGHNEKGWLVYCDDWGHVGPFRYSIVAVRPLWAMYGK